MPRRMFLYDPIKLFSNSLILSRIIGVIQDYYLEELLIKIGWMHFLKTLFGTDTHAHTSPSATAGDRDEFASWWPRNATGAGWDGQHASQRTSAQVAQYSACASEPQP